ncbi:MAG: hypothetical protein ABI877_12955, partial [Gemmatimonadaceae bacterium]
IDSVWVTKAEQFSLPLTAFTPIGGGWRVDATALYALGTVKFRPSGATGGERSARLSGVSDVRLRATGRFLTDALTLTIGANVPSGRTTLTGAEFSALRVLAAPALGMGSTPVGAGPSGTAGAVLSEQAGAWALAFGASYEHRGRYQPVAALVSGTPSADFRPGGVVRASVGADRIVGRHRLSLAMAADVFADDRLRGVPDGSPAGTPTTTLATVRLGPVLTGDAQLLLASNRFRELILYTSYYWRSAYSRDGRTAEGSSGKYLATGLRAALPLRTRTDLILAGDGRWHSGLGIDQGLPTSGVRSASLTMGLNARRQAYSLQPYLRAQVGSLHQRGSAQNLLSKAFVGTAVGVVVITKF